MYIILSKEEVAKEMIVVPGELKYDFYFKEVSKNNRAYYAVTPERCLKFYTKQD